MKRATEWLDQARHLGPGLVAAAALAAAVLITPMTVSGNAAGGNNAGGAAGSSADGLTAGGTGVGGTGAPGTGASAGGLGGAGGSGAGASAGAGFGSSSAAAAAAVAAKGKTYQGVTATSVLMGTAAATNSCGGFDQSAVRSAYGLAPSNDQLSYKEAVAYFNKYPLTDYPLPASIRAHVNAKTGFWGRHITTVFRDSGGYACQDVGRANAVTMAEKDKVFGLIMPNTDGPEVPMSLVMAQHHLIHIGRWMTGPLFWKQRAPYFFDGWHGDGVEQNTALGSWICRDWVNKKGYNTGDVRVTGMPRKFGILFPDDPEFHEVANVLESEVGRCGLHPKQYAIPFDLQTLEAQAQATVSRMMQDGVTTILSVNDFLTRLMSSEAATNQGWHPEWVLSGWGIGSYPGAYNTFMDPTQAPNAWCACDAAAVNMPSWNHLESYLAWKKVMPSQEPPGGWNNFYWQFKLLALGLAGAGPDLNPTTFAHGLNLLCDPCARANALLPLMIVPPGHYTNREGFTLTRWDPNKPDVYDPPGNNGQPKAGYFDFLENGKRYLLRITDPDTGIGVQPDGSKD